MFEPLGKSVSTVIDERLSNPLVSSFAIAWPIINWRFLVILLSDNSVTTRFDLIKQHCYPDLSAALGWGLAVPFAAALVYIYWLPLLFQPVFKEWRINQQGTENIKNKYPIEKVLSQEESWEYQKKQLELEGQLNQERLTVRTLRGDLNVASDKLDELESLKKQMEQQRIESQALKDKVRDVGQDLAKAQTIINNQRQRLDEARKSTEELSSKFPSARGGLLAAAPDETQLAVNALRSVLNLPETPPATTVTGNKLFDMLTSRNQGSKKS